MELPLCKLYRADRLDVLRLRFAALPFLPRALIGRDAARHQRTLVLQIPQHLLAWEQDPLVQAVNLVVCVYARGCAYVRARARVRAGPGGCSHARLSVCVCLYECESCT